MTANELKSAIANCSCAPCAKIREMAAQEGVVLNAGPQNAPLRPQPIRDLAPDDVLPIPVMNFEPEPEQQDRAPVANRADDDVLKPYPMID